MPNITAILAMSVFADGTRSFCSVARESERQPKSDNHENTFSLVQDYDLCEQCKSIVQHEHPLEQIKTLVDDYKNDQGGNTRYESIQVSLSKPRQELHDDSLTGYSLPEAASTKVYTNKSMRSRF